MYSNELRFFYSEIKIIKHIYIHALNLISMDIDVLNYHRYLKKN